MKKIASSAAVVTASMMILTLGSKLFGFVREMFLANYFGTSYVVDAYVISTDIPGFLFYGILSSIATAFIPIYSKIATAEGRIGADLFLSRIINILLCISVLVGLIGLLLSRQLVYIFAHGWFLDDSMKPAIELANFFVKVTFLTVVFNSLLEIQNSYQRYYRHYYTPIVASYTLSASIIAFIIIAYKINVRLIVFGTLIGYFIRFLIGAIAIRIRKYRHKWDFHFNDAIKRVLILSIPVFIGTTLSQVTIFVDKFMVTWLPEGSISALNYGFLVQDMFIVIVGVTFAQYIYPKMSQSFAAGDFSQWKNQFSNGLGMLLALGVPIGMGCLVFSHEIIRLIFERGAFDVAATDLTAAVFFCYSLSMAFQMLMLFLVQTYYSAHNTKTPVIISSICAALNVIGNLILIGPFGLHGIAISTSFALCVNTIILLAVLNKKNPGMIASGFLRKLVKIICASVVAIGMAFAAYRALAILSIFETSSSSIIQLIHLGAAAVVAVIAYLFALHFLKVDEIQYLKQTVRDVRGAK